MDTWLSHDPRAGVPGFEYFALNGERMYYVLVAVSAKNKA